MSLIGTSVTEPTTSTVATIGTGTFTIGTVGVVVEVEDEVVAHTDNCFSIYSGDGSCFSISASEPDCFWIKGNDDSEAPLFPPEDIDLSEYGMISVYSIHAQGDTLYALGTYKETPTSDTQTVLRGFIISNQSVTHGIELNGIYGHLVLDSYTIPIGSKLIGYMNDSNLYTFGIATGSEFIFINPVTISVRATVAYTYTNPRFLEEEILFIGYNNYVDVSDGTTHTQWLNGLDDNEDIVTSETVTRNFMPSNIQLFKTAYFVDDVGFFCCSGSSTLPGIGINVALRNIYTGALPPNTYGLHTTTSSYIDNGTSDTWDVDKICYDKTHIVYGFNTGIVALNKTDVTGSVVDLSTITTPVLEDSSTPTDHTLANGAVLMLEDGVLTQVEIE